MAKNSKNKIVLELELSEQDYVTLKENSPEGDISNFVKTCSEAYLHEYSQGGLMLSADEVNRINKHAEKAVSNSSDIVNLAEKAGKTKSGSKTFTVTLDPALVDSFKAQAAFQGITVDEFIQQCWSFIHANGWLYQMNPDVTWIPLSDQDVKYIKTKVTADVVTSKEVLEVVRKAAA